MLKELFATEKKWIVFASVFALMITFSNLGSDGMAAAQEGRTAIIVRNMLLSGNYLDMKVDHGILYEKPIGHYWLCLPTAFLFGLQKDPMTVSPEWALRLPSAFCALAMLFAAALLAYRMYGSKTCAATIVILSSMNWFLHLGRLAHIDMPLASAYTCAMAFLFFGYFEKWKSNAWIYGFYFFMGWGVLLKGPLPVLLAGLTVFVMMLIYRRWRMLWEIRPVSGGLLFLLVALPWYIIESIRTNGAFYQEFIINQNIRRFTGVGSTYRNGERMPLWYYFPKLAANALPWSIPAIAAILLNLKMLWKRTPLRSCTVFLLVWACSGFIFFSLSALKRGDYLLPLYAALAILTARAIVIGCEKAGSFPRWWRIVWHVINVVLALTVLISVSVGNRICEYLNANKIRFISRNDAMNMAACFKFANEYWYVVVLAVVILSAVLFCFGWLCEKKKYYEAFGLFSIWTLCVFLTYYCGIMPVENQIRTVKPLIREARKIIPEGERVAFLDFNTELIFFMNRPYEVMIKPGIRYAFADDRQSEILQKQGWTVLLKTQKDHRYPEVLLQKK